VGAQTWPVTLEAQGVAPSVVASGGFVARRFSFTMPGGVPEAAILEVTRTDGTALRAVIDVAGEAASGESDTKAPATPLDQIIASAPASSALMRNFAGRFLPNQPVYFIYGSGAEPPAKFQFSFDYRLATWVYGEPGTETITTFRVGYTQRSLWDIGGESSPFYDTSYMPEFVFETDAPKPSDDGGFFTWLGLRGGFQHESNGRDGADSRSLNILYARARFALGSFQNWFCVVLPEINGYVGDLSDNPDISDYRGYGKLRLYIGRNDGPSLLFSGWTGKDFDHGTWQVDVSVPLNFSWLKFESFLHLQYFNGYGESLRAYDEHSEALRLGIGFVR
jgi:outer membrane phospholipase A